MRISIFPKGELDRIVDGEITVQAWIRQAEELAIEGVELYSGFFAGGSDSFVDDVAATLNDCKLEMPMLCASPDLTHPDAAVRAQQIEQQIQMIQITHRISGEGASTRVLTGQRHPEVGREQGIRWFLEAMDELLPVARELDILLGLENHYKDGSWAYPEFAQKPDVFMEILSRVEEDTHFGVQFDPSNAIVAGVDSAAFLVDVIDRVYTMQASDRWISGGASLDDLRQSDGTLGYSPLLQHGVIGQGLNNYDSIFRTLSVAGYDGWISVEDGVNGWGEMKESVDFLCQVRQDYFGGSYKATVANHVAARRRKGLPVVEREQGGWSK